MDARTISVLSILTRSQDQTVHTNLNNMKVLMTGTVQTRDKDGMRQSWALIAVRRLNTHILPVRATVSSILFNTH
jgi:hypothetical protein